MSEKTILETSTYDPKFWNNSQEAKNVTIRISELTQIIDNDKKLANIQEELELYKEVIELGLGDEGTNNEINALIEKYRKIVASEELALFLSDENDNKDCIIEINSGSGGLEAQDWAGMLFRMYLKFCKSKNFIVTVLDIVEVESAGIKNTTLKVEGKNAYGLLKSETGVHRLVRMSPYNANNKRQTSFSSVFVYPIIEDDIEIEIDEKDLNIDVYRSGGKGGQSVNTTDSAVRITHKPTKIVVCCQNERSQSQNKIQAMKVLKSRLYDYYENEKKKEQNKIESSKTDISWGNQIRSYVLEPNQIVTDTRTGLKIYNFTKVLDGDLDELIDSYLRWNVNNG